MDKEEKRLKKGIFGWKPSKNFSVFVICLSIALTFWLLNAFTKYYNTTLNIPLQYVNLPSDKVLVSELPEKLHLEVSGFGFSLLTYFLWSGEDKMVIDYDNAEIKRRGSKVIRVLGGQTLKEMAALELPGDIKIEHVLNDTLRIILENLEKKELPVVAKLNISTTDQFFVSGQIEVEPSEVMVSGPPSILDKVDTIYTQLFEAVDLEENLTEMLLLDIPKLLSIRVEEVQVNIPIDRFTEGEISVPITVSGNYQDSSIMLFPSVVQVKYLAGLKDFDKIDHKQFKYEVELIDFTSHKSYLIVRQKAVPEKVKVLNYEPHKVEYIIKK